MFDDRDKNASDEKLEDEKAADEKAAEDLFPELPEEEPAGADAEESAAGDEAVDADDLFLDLPEAEAVEAAEAAAGADATAAEATPDAQPAALGGEGDLLDAIDIDIPAEDLAEIERRSRLEWFAIHANTGHENKVKRNIEMAIKSNHMEESFGDVLVPIQEVTEMKNGKRVTSKRKFLPGYLLVQMLMSKETHHFINSVPGVTGFIGGTPQRPQPVPDEEIERILGRVKEPDEGKDMLEIPYSVGDSVQVIDGAFTDWVGIINEINHEKGKLKVMISIFGKDTPVELDFLQVKQV
jgi:transcriptional antiterminator NusG